MAAAISKVGYCCSCSRKPLRSVPPDCLLAITLEVEAVAADLGGHICSAPHWPHLLAVRGSLLLQLGLEQRLVSAFTVAPVSMSYPSALSFPALSQAEGTCQVPVPTMGFSRSLLPAQPTGPKEGS